MTYPLISEYKAAILAAEDNLATKIALRPVCNSNGEPIMTSGNYAVVFKMEDTQTGRLYAVKCFLRDQERRESSYEKISRALSIYPKIYWTSFQYLEKELFVDSRNTDESEFPIVLMDWIEGTDLGTFVDSHYRDSQAMAKITYEFCKMAKWICGLPIAHGDVKPDNIIVTSRHLQLVLVDYDGMFVPEMEGEAPRELGSPVFRHPFRDKVQYDSYIDDFSFALIAMSLRAICLDSSIYKDFGSPDHLLFSEGDIINPNSPVKVRMRDYLKDASFLDLARLFDSALKYGDLRFISLSNFVLPAPCADTDDLISKDEGFALENDGENLVSYKGDKDVAYIPTGVRKVEPFAFNCIDTIKTVVLPETLESIENDAFYHCVSLSEVEFKSVPNQVKKNAFHNCWKLKDIVIPLNTKAEFERIDCIKYYHLIER